MHTLLKFLKYYWGSKTLHQIHSPFVYEFTKHVLEDKRHFYAFDEIEKIRSVFLNDTRQINLKDYGAGSRVSGSNTRLISEIAATSISDPKQIQLLFRIIYHLKPQRILEFGTSLGLSAYCMQRANPAAEIITVEGDDQLSRIASKLFITHNLPIQLINDKFSEVSTSLSIDNRSFDCFFLDGHHSYSATLQYIDRIADRIENGGMIIIDDINWSKSMINAWKELQNDKRFSLSIDLFYKGILIKNESLKEKQKYKLIAKKYKPFSLGLWA